MWLEQWPIHIYLSFWEVGRAAQGAGLRFLEQCPDSAKVNEADPQSVGLCHGLQWN